MRKRQITIKDLARELNVSKSTVSRALRDSPDINTETKKRVLDLVAALDYQPNSMALSLFRGKSHTIGVIIPSFTIPFYAGVISGLQDVANQEGYNIITCQSNESLEQEIRNVDTLIRSSVDGLAISLSRQTQSVDHILKLRAKGIPVVLFNRVSDQIAASKVVVDDYRGAYTVVKHLIACGKQRIAHLAGPPGLRLTENRLNGYLHALRDHGLSPATDEVLHSDFTTSSGRELAAELLNRQPLPDALFCVCDAVAFGAMSSIRHARLHIPGDIAVAGFTDEPVSALLSPPLTTVSQPMEEIGRTAATLLFNEIRCRTLAVAYRTVEVETQLMIRESTVGPCCN